MTADRATIRAGAFRHKAFAVVWTGTLIANIGTWMYTAASGWMMTSLSPDPLMVALVQVASSLPIFLFAIPAGVLADIVDKRKFLIIAEAVSTVVAAGFAALVWRGLVTPAVLLLFTMLIGAMAAVTAPAWQAIVPLLVPRRDLRSAIAADAVAINASRAVGPGLGGATTAAFGIAAPFWINAVSNLAVIVALVWWRPPQRTPATLPPETFGPAIRSGLRHVAHNRFLRATLVRAVAFFLFGCAYWAVLPTLARQQIAGGPEVYGVLLGGIGTGAIVGAMALPWLNARLSADRLTMAGTAGTAVAMILFGLARGLPVAIVASLVAGISWISVLSSLNVSAQVAIPEWVRARGLAVFVTAMYGAIALGSVAWGKVASAMGLPTTLFLAATGALVAMPLTRRWKLQLGALADLTPSLHWAPPVLARKVQRDAGPVLVTVQYVVAPNDRFAFVEALRELSRERRRDGAYQWGVFEDTAESGRFLETFLTETWEAHLRQHGRVTHFDRALEAAVDRLLTEPPKISHLVSAAGLRTPPAKNHGERTSQRRRPRPNGSDPRPDGVASNGPPPSDANATKTTSPRCEHAP